MEIITGKLEKRKLKESEEGDNYPNVTIFNSPCNRIS